MRVKFFSFLLALSTLLADPPLTLYKIDPMIRGPEIEAIVTMFNLPPYRTRFSEVGIQMGNSFFVSPSFAPYVQQGFIPYVQSAASSLNGTLLTVTYLPNGASTRNQYLIVPVEQMALVVYSPKPISELGFGSSFPQGVLPRYDIDAVMRAADLKLVFDDFNTLPIYQNGKQNTVGIFTTLSGVFNPPIQGGFIPNVQTITASGAYLTIEYLPFSENGRTYNKQRATIIVTAEQVIQMVYFPNRVTGAIGL